jgi:hypothetical protein
MTVMQASTCQTRLHPFAQAVFWIVAAFYAYGALVHILNIASLTGFSWPEAPSKWQVLDIGYLLVDMVVVVGLVRRSWIGIAAFFLAAISQIALYTVFRDWVLNVPEVFQRSAEDLAYLDGLVVFHVVTCLVMAMATVVGRPRSMPQPASGH